MQHLKTKTVLLNTDRAVQKFRSKSPSKTKTDTNVIMIILGLPGVPKKTDLLDYFDDNFDKYGPILTIFFTVTTRNL